MLFRSVNPANGSGRAGLLLRLLLGLGLWGERLWRGGQQAAQEVVRALLGYVSRVQVQRIELGLRMLLLALLLVGHGVESMP